MTSGMNIHYIDQHKCIYNCNFGYVCDCHPTSNINEFLLSAFEMSSTEETKMIKFRTAFKSLKDPIGCSEPYIYIA